MIGAETRSSSTGAWRNYVIPVDLLDDRPEQQQRALFAALLALEVDFRFALGEQPTLDDFRDRFSRRHPTTPPASR